VVNEFDPFKHVARNSIPGLCVWKKSGWEEKRFPNKD
jgi:hypothetical protein